MKYDSIDRSRIILAVFAIVTLLGVLIFSAHDDATSKPMAINGDILGPYTEESRADYEQRAAASLETADWEDPSYALMTFSQPLTAETAGALTQPLKRVSAMIVGCATPIALPEPTRGHDRADVYSQEFDAIERALAGVAQAPQHYQLTAVVAYDSPAALKNLAVDPKVEAVEVLPPDAAWGNFGIRPACYS